MLGLAGTLAICHLQNNALISDVLFEVYSAIGTVGMSTGITRELTDASRIIISLLNVLRKGRKYDICPCLYREKIGGSHIAA